jgi:hypothetical protein
MPKYRQLHTKIIDSFDFNEMPDDFTRVVWLLLTLILDREGRGIDSPVWIKSKMFPMRTDITDQEIRNSFDWLEKRKMIVRYKNTGRCYFYIPTFQIYQSGTLKESPSVLPAPDLVQSYSGEGPEKVSAAASASASALESESVNSTKEKKEIAPDRPSWAGRDEDGNPEYQDKAPMNFTDADLLILDRCYSTVTGFMPPKEVDRVRATIRVIATNNNLKIIPKNEGAIAAILRPYYLEMCKRKNKHGKPYSKSSLFWLFEWAASGEIPPVWTDSPPETIQRQDPSLTAKIRERLKKETK